jgi:hypothetical protein
MLQLLLPLLTQLGDELAILLGEVDVLSGMLDIAPQFSIFVKLASSVHGTGPSTRM